MTNAPGARRRTLIVLIYILIFWALLPAMVFAAGRVLDDMLPAARSLHPVLGWPSAALGAVLLLYSSGLLFRYGRGLPISHLPPTRFVARGAYRFARHPIYLGFTALLCGGSLLARSGGSFLISLFVFPAAWFLYAHFYEEPILERRFPETYAAYKRETGLFGPRRGPLDAKARPAYAGLALFLYNCWTALYYWTGHIAMDASRRHLFTPLDRLWPFVAEFEFVYIWSYFIPFLPLILLKEARSLNRLLFAFVIFSLSSFLIYIYFPVYMPRPSITGDSPALLLLSWEYAMDPPVNNFPSHHVAVVWLAYLACRRTSWAANAGLLGATILIGMAALFVKQHYAADIIAGILFSWIAYWIAGWSLGDEGDRTGGKKDKK